MDRLNVAQLDEYLAHVERNVAHVKRPSSVQREIGRYLGYLHRNLLEKGGPIRIDSVEHDRLHRFMRRAHTVRTPQDATRLINEIRQYLQGLSSLNRTAEIESRIRDLEEQLKSTAEGTEGPAIVPGAETVTLESFKGKRMLFAIMPFSKEFEDVWVGGIKRAASGTGLTPVRIDMLTQSTEITDDIVQAIQLSEVVVVDVTGNNANVMFEFGFALASKKKHVIISQSTNYLTFDIKNLRTLIYLNTWQGIETLHKDLQPFIKGALGKSSRQMKKKSKSESSGD